MIISGILTGICAGLVLSLIQHFQVTPLILEAETYEQPSTTELSTETSHHDVRLENNQLEWTPDNGTERTLFTVLSNIFAGIGFSLVLIAAFIFSRHKGWQVGILWGIAAYTTFYLAPALGLPPELPGSINAELHQRQWWWIITVISTAVGLGLVLLNKVSTFRVLGIFLLIAPHIFGAPIPPLHNSVVPHELTQSFIVATSIANLIFWCLIGGLNGYLTRKMLIVDSLQNA